MSLKDRVSRVLEKISSAAQKSGRSQRGICLLAVSKRQAHSNVREAFYLGVRHFGENYIQEYKDKVKYLEDLKINWHFIGPLQSKKVKDVIGNFSTIHSVDRMKVIREMDRRSIDKGYIQKIFLQVNFSNEKSKSGFSEKEIPNVLETIQCHKGLQICGLMVMPKPVDNGEINRHIFSKAKSCSIEWKKYLSGGHHLNELSMGTSQDFETAIEEGATIVRIGSSLLGPRL